METTTLQVSPDFVVAPIVYKKARCDTLTYLPIFVNILIFYRQNIIVPQTISPHYVPDKNIPTQTKDPPSQLNNLELWGIQNQTLDDACGSIGVETRKSKRGL